MQSMAAKTLVDVQSGLKFAKSPQWIERKLTFLDIHDRCIKSADMDGNVQTIGALPHLPDSLHALAARPCLYDTVVDSHGGMYVADIGFDFLDPLVDPVPNGMIIYVNADGESSVAAEELYFPGGLIIPLDNKTLIIAESLRHRLTAFAIGAAGALGNRRVWAQFDDDINPQGICMDRDGSIWIAGAGRRALLVEEGGVIKQQVTTERPVFATAIGGLDQDFLFLCTSDSNDPVITRQAAGATIDFADVGAL